MRKTLSVLLAVYFITCSYGQWHEGEIAAANTFLIMAYLLLMQINLDQIMYTLSGSRITKVNSKSHPPRSE